MRISLDWDKITRKTANLRVKLILKNKNVFFVELRRSPSGKGYHCYVMTYNAFDDRRMEFYYRRKWWDDKKRIKMDKMRCFSSVLFQEKHIGDKIYYEKLLKVWQK